MKTAIYWIIGIIILGGLVALLVREAKKPGQYDAFAQCLTEKGATFYGAFWCPHCQRQKALFGRSAKKIPYVECSTKDGKGVLPVCEEAKVESYPTWIFADGSRTSGAQNLEALAAKTACSIE